MEIRTSVEEGLDEDACPFRSLLWGKRAHSFTSVQDEWLKKGEEREIRSTQLELYLLELH